MLPRLVDRVQVPPIKTQGIKTKLVPFILANLNWNGEGRWIEPFLGSGVVLFNSGAHSMLGADANRHIVEFYVAVQQERITAASARAYLQAEGEKLREIGDSHYYAVRDRFNASGNPLDFLFLNRSCFNGVMRFNSKGKFNVPFCKKPDRFAPALITKIANQIAAMQRLFRSARDVSFVSQNWRVTLEQARPGDFVYLDPPYIGRHTDYYNQWTEQDARDLADMARQLPCGFALSMWQENRYRRNEHIDDAWGGLVVRTMSHFYHVGSTEALRNEMIEALVIRPGSEAAQPPEPLAKVVEDDDPQPETLELFA
jgi:DNA adenine methylase